MSDITPLSILAEWVVSDGGHRCPPVTDGFDRQCKYAGEGYKTKCASCIEQWAIREHRNYNGKESVLEREKQNVYRVAFGD